MSQLFLQLFHALLAYLGHSPGPCEIGFSGENAAYSGITFDCGGRCFEFRVAKKTPVKQGYFSVLWKRSVSGESIPYSDKDVFDKLVVVVARAPQVRFFVFPKAVLVQYGILTSASFPGKRGFRVYEPSEMLGSRQARATQAWQAPFFVKLVNE